MAVTGRIGLVLIDGEALHLLPEAGDRGGPATLAAPNPWPRSLQGTGWITRISHLYAFDIGWDIHVVESVPGTILSLDRALQYLLDFFHLVIINVSCIYVILEGLIEEGRTWGNSFLSPERGLEPLQSPGSCSLSKKNIEQWTLI